MSYTRPQFGKCVFNPMVDEPIRIAYPKINSIIDPGLSQDSALDSVIRYIIMVYDPQSPLIKGERDLGARKDMAFFLTGINDESIQKELFDCTHQYAPELTLKYLMHFANSKLWAAIVATEFCFWESIQQLTKPINGKDTRTELDSVEKKAKIKDGMDADIKRLDAYYKAYFADDIALDEQVRKRKRFTPEGIMNNA